MTHPFVGDLSGKTIDEIQTKISELTTKLTFAGRMGNRTLMNQLIMALDSYKEAYQSKITEMANKQNLQGKIQIDKK